MDKPEAIENIFRAKQRQAQKPLPVLAAHWQQVESIAHVGQYEQTLAEQFWPGPLTLICPAKAHVLPLLTAGTGKVAVRISSHALARALAQAVHAPLVCSSANMSGEAPPRQIQELSTQLLQSIPHVLDLDVLSHEAILKDSMPMHKEKRPKPAQYIEHKGLPSTIVEVVGEKKLTIRRHGAIAEEELQAQGWEIV